MAKIQKQTRTNKDKENLLQNFIQWLYNNGYYFVLNKNKLEELSALESIESFINSEISEDDDKKRVKIKLHNIYHNNIAYVFAKKIILHNTKELWPQFTNIYEIDKRYFNKALKRMCKVPNCECNKIIQNSNGISSLSNLRFIYNECIISPERIKIK